MRLLGAYVRRKTNSYDFKPYLSLVLAVQPKVLSNLGHNRAYSGNGALERFLYVSNLAIAPTTSHR